MKALPFLLLLSLCSTIPSISCEKADRVRAAAAVAMQALDRVCPIGPSRIL